jgi:Fe-S cluster assembly protein SufD
MSATVIAASDHEEAYVAAYRHAGGTLPGGARLRRTRQSAIERFSALGFPTTHDEEWKYTSLAPFLKTPYQPAATGVFTGELPAASPGAPRLVFVNGRFAPELSQTCALKGLKISPLKEALARRSIADRIGATAAFENNALVALNTAMFEDGALVEIGDGAVIDAPVELLFLSASNGTPAVAYPRTLIVAGRESQAQIVETYRGGGTGLRPVGTFTSAVTEAAIADGAVIEHYKLQEESHETLHFGMLAVRQGASSNFVSHNIAFGGALARNEIAVVLDGEGAECTLNGLYVTGGRQHIDNYTTLDHAQPHSNSRELYKGVLDGKSQAVFHGRIIVRPEAQKTDAIQRNKNLLLSDGAVINTKPQLEIYADDVKCTHGATVGQVDADAIFYLRSRGIALNEARKLLTYAFTSEMAGVMKVESVRERVGAALLDRLASAAGGEE